jgi:lariat debranching enzyme
MHGELDKVYATLKRLEEVENTKIDLLICCGDFQVSLFAWVGANLNQV